jgi:hypothetical protein
MAKLTRKEFQDLTGKSKNYVNSNIVRGKIIIENNLIDTDNIVNIAFIENVKRLKEGGNAKKEVLQVDKIEREEKPDVAERREIQTKKAQSQLSIFNLQEQKTQKEVEKLSVDIQLKEVQLSKVRGELVPYDIVQELIAQFGKALVSEFDNAADLVLQKITNTAKLSPALVAESREFIKTANNAAQKKAKVSTLKQMEIIISSIKE